MEGQGLGRGRGGSALTSSVPGLGLQSSLKRATAEQSEEALLQEAEALAEVTAQEKGGGHRPREGTSGIAPSLHLMTSSARVILQTTPHSTAILPGSSQVASLDLPSGAHACNSAPPLL